jgi:hypothetical protein
MKISIIKKKFLYISFYSADDGLKKKNIDGSFHAIDGVFVPKIPTKLTFCKAILLIRNFVEQYFLFFNILYR